jgi:hypothetical protein
VAGFVSPQRIPWDGEKPAADFHEPANRNNRISYLTGCQVDRQIPDPAEILTGRIAHPRAGWFLRTENTGVTPVHRKFSRVFGSVRKTFSDHCQNLLVPVLVQLADQA